MQAPADFQPERLHRPDWYVEQGGQWHLRASRCSGCGMLTFPAATVCPRCWPPQAIEDATVPETGTLLSWTTASIAPAQFRPPYSFGYVDVASSIRLFAQIECRPDDPPLLPDMRIRLVLGVVRIDDEGQPVWGYKLAPIVKEVS